MAQFFIDGQEIDLGTFSLMLNPDAAPIYQPVCQHCLGTGIEPGDPFRANKEFCPVCRGDGDDKAELSQRFGADHYMPDEVVRALAAIREANSRTTEGFPSVTPLATIVKTTISSIPGCTIEKAGG